MEQISLETVTLEDCLEAFEKKGKTVVINNGQIVEIREKED